VRFNPGCGCCGTHPCDPPCAGGMPNTIYLTFVNVSGAACLDGLTIRLDWDPAFSWWNTVTTPYTVCGESWSGWPIGVTGADVPGRVTGTLSCGAHITGSLTFNCGTATSDNDWTISIDIAVTSCAGPTFGTTANFNVPSASALPASGFCLALPHGGTVRLEMSA
jgi:hypothetical protein